MLGRSAAKIELSNRSVVEVIIENLPTLGTETIITWKLNIAMSDVQLYLVEVVKDKDEARRIAGQSASKLANGDLKLVALIESIGEYLNNDEAQYRVKTLAYLADVLEQVPPKVLSGQQRNLLCGFVLSRAQDDTDGTGLCARALMALEERGKWDQETVQNIINAYVGGHLRREHVGLTVHPVSSATPLLENTNFRASVLRFFNY